MYKNIVDYIYSLIGEKYDSCQIICVDIRNGQYNYVLAISYMI